jgi:hypothetical protein
MRLAHVNKNKVAVYLEMNHFSSVAQQPLMGQCLLIIETSRSQWDTLHSVGLSGRVISSTHRPLPDTTLTKDRSMPPRGIRTCKPNMRAAADPRWGPRSDGNGSPYMQMVTCRCLSCTLRWTGTAACLLNCWHTQTHDMATWQDKQLLRAFHWRHSRQIIPDQKVDWKHLWLFVNTL